MGIILTEARSGRLGKRSSGSGKARRVGQSALAAGIFPLHDNRVDPPRQDPRGACAMRLLRGAGWPLAPGVSRPAKVDHRVTLTASALRSACAPRRTVPTPQRRWHPGLISTDSH